ncbi:transcriptional regulator TetR family [Patulibacter medicamentivorans]|uniref:Transcriptional regulator TetR family n=1 Tax=Patulibacter medicamentivorans TaxID=1097667 RepID=H0E3W8_9ACTN|nr:TetR/AcrR family transcriptional regulator [Patulibacter medicamentivorans]EHN11616.1 transcriptional regulator TetR family [Patulibacter medicamentivorans]
MNPISTEAERAVDGALAPSARRPARGERRAARTRAAILDAAERAFRVDGYRGTKVEDVAEAADVAIGSIYSHFGSKDGLYHALAERSVELFAAYMAQAYTDDRTPLEQVLAAGDTYLRFHLEHPGAFRFLAFDGVETAPIEDDAVRARISDRIEQLIERFRQQIQAAIDSGEARPLDARQLSRFLWGAWNGVIALSLRPDRMALSDDEVAACIQTGRRLVLEGLVAPAARDAAGDAKARLVRVDSPPDPA